MEQIQPAMSDLLKASLTIKSCYCFLKAHELEKSEKSKLLILDKVEVFLDTVNQLYNA